jgi:hypothetical protein
MKNIKILCNSSILHTVGWLAFIYQASYLKNNSKKSAKITNHSHIFLASPIFMNINEFIVNP